MNYANLVLQLREVASKGISTWGDLQREAANAIELLQEQLKVVRGQLSVEVYLSVPKVQNQVSSGNWQARILVGKVRKNLGTFTSYEEAVAARVAAEQLHWRTV